MEINTNNSDRNENQKEEKNEFIDKNINQELFGKKILIEDNQKNKERIIKMPLIKRGKKNKGYVRLFRNYIKKKDKLRKAIILNRFRQWIKQSLKDSIIKKRVIVRISVSRGRDFKNEYFNKFNIKNENEDGKSKSLNKQIIKSIDKIKNSQNNIKISNYYNE